MGLEAATKALLDAGITYDEVEIAYVGYCYGDSTSGQVCCVNSPNVHSHRETFACQRALYSLGMTGIPITNVNNNCSTGSTALFSANAFVRGGQVECALALGFERMAPGSLKSNWTDREPPMKPWHIMMEMTEETLGQNHGPGAPRMFGNGGQEYFDKYGGNMETLAKIGKSVQESCSSDDLI